MDRITEKRQLRLNAINANLSLIKPYMSFNNAHQRERYLTYLQEANVENSVLSAIKDIINPGCGPYNGSIVGLDRWDQILNIMIDHHELTHPTWEFIMAHGEEELKRRLKKTFQENLLTNFDQFLNNRRLGTLAADRRTIIAEELLEKMESTVAAIQKEYYDAEDEEFPQHLDNLIKFFNQIEESMRYLLRDKSVNYNGNLMKKNNPFTVIESLSDIIERLSNDLDKACWDVKGDSQQFKNARAELAEVRDRLSNLEKKNEHLKDNNDKLQNNVIALEDELEEKEQECNKTARELVTQTIKVEEAHTKLSKRDYQFDQMMEMVKLQAESMDKQKEYIEKALQTQTEATNALTENVKDLTSKVSSITSSVSTIENTVKKTMNELPNTRKVVVNDVTKALKAQYEVHANAQQKQTEQMEDLTKDVKNLKSVFDESENKMAGKLSDHITSSIRNEFKVSVNALATTTIRATAKEVKKGVDQLEKHVQNHSEKIQTEVSGIQKEVSGKLAALKRDVKTNNHGAFEVIKKSGNMKVVNIGQHMKNKPLKSHKSCSEP